MQIRIFFIIIGIVSCLAQLANATLADHHVYKLIGTNDALLVTDEKGNSILSKNANKPLIPASTLKIITALTAIKYLGEDFRFVTEFYVDRNHNLKMKGYGDPLLVSEILSDIATQISLKGKPTFNHIIVDHSYFETPIIVPGVESSYEPYDASNGALCVNFNTVNFIKNKDQTISSAEPQTPMIPYAIDKIKKSGINQGRITFSQKNDENALYAGHLFRFFLEKQGCEISGKVLIGKVGTDDILLYRYVSKFSLKDVIAKLMEFSNNFIANQVLLATGAQVFGSPGNLAKGVKAATLYVSTDLKIFPELVEGSGISRNNKISPESMEKALRAFEPYRYLMRSDGKQWYKTGTLTGISTRAGYIEGKDGHVYRFVVMMNTSGKSAESVVSTLLQLFR